jgi:hypothetical protein
LNVLVLTNHVPFTRENAQDLSELLLFHLRRQGVQAEALHIPFAWEPAERLIEEMLISRSLRVGNVDRLIALKFPSYLVPHPNKVIWLSQQYRPAYDLFDAEQSNIREGASGRRIRKAIRCADNLAFAEARRIYTHAKLAADRLRRYNGFRAKVLAPPVDDPGLEWTSTVEQLLA